MGRDDYYGSSIESASTAKVRYQTHVDFLKDMQ